MSTLTYFWTNVMKLSFLSGPETGFRKDHMHSLYHLFCSKSNACPQWPQDYQENTSTIRLKSRKGYFLLLYILKKNYHLSLWTCVQCDTITQRYTLSQTENLNIHYYQSKVYSKKVYLWCHITILQIQAISLIHLKKRSEKVTIKSNAIFCPLLISVHHAQTSRHC